MQESSWPLDIQPQGWLSALVHRLYNTADYDTAYRNFNDKGLAGKDLQKYLKALWLNFSLVVSSSVPRRATHACTVVTRRGAAALLTKPPRP